ncbi:MAG TPA: lipoprotein-releasing system transmembrane subunit LolC, partial [Deltaproteobacteria bacterium]|nr:lipoprotein-releasing system transmembrane subunit LolC [Deltaproteobacteria bacterium]
MNFELFISLKHLRTKRGKSLLSLLTIISVVGVAVGVMTLIVVLAVMNGFQNDLRSKILGITSHIMVFKIGNVINDYDKIIKKVENTEGVRAATPFIQTQVMISGYRAVSGAILRGIDPDTVPRVLNLPSIMKSGSLSDLKPTSQPFLGSTPPIILGIELATNLGIGVGGIVNVISPVGRLTPLGQAPKSQKFIVVGLFESGLYNYDNSLA